MTVEEKSARSIVTIGPFHPLQEEPGHFRLHVDGEIVTKVDINIGYNHRGIEKLCESRNWEQVVFLVERICGICSTSHPIASVQAMEDCGNIEVPERALYIRSIIGELERIHSHLLWAGLAGHFIGYNTVFAWAWKWREPVLDIFEKTTGNRNHYGVMKPGGVWRDIEEQDIPWIFKQLDALEPKIHLLAGAVQDDPVLHARLKGVGILTPEDIRRYSALGPTARGSGVPIDVRRDHPYAAYGKVDWKVITYPTCDIYAKAVVRVLECLESIKIIRQCLQKMPKGEIDSKPTSIPPGEGVGHHEAPRGEVFHYCRSDGSNRPARYKARAPTYMNLPTDYTAVVGESITDAALVLAAIDPCYSCTERTGVFHYRTGELLYSGKDLLRMSHEKTARLRKEIGK